MTGCFCPVTVQASPSLAARVVTSSHGLRMPGSVWASACQNITRSDVVEQLLLLFGAHLSDEAAGDQRSACDRFRRKASTDFGHDGRDLDLARLLGIQAEPEDAHLGELRSTPRGSSRGRC